MCLSLLTCAVVDLDQAGLLPSLEVALEEVLGAVGA
jgi:hypothetical protein